MKPTAAKGPFPYRLHRTMAEVMRDERQEQFRASRNRRERHALDQRFG
ncbi:hypothetical protein [Croceicoccus sp. Ery15]|nr:hypothetical protein [Croceicoccus sp. Ery15]